MPKPQKRRDVIRFLRSRGWAVLRQGGEHELWHDPATGAKLSIPRHRELSAGIIAQISDQVPDAPQEWR